MSRLSHQPHVALFSRVLAGEEREEVVQQWIEGQSMLMESCSQHQDRGEVGRRILHVSSPVPPHLQGVISEGGLHQALREVFPFKPPTSVSQLTACAAHTAQTSGGCVDYTKMLSPVGIVTTCVRVYSQYRAGSEHMSV